jgi:hypothetical protein
MRHEAIFAPMIGFTFLVFLLWMRLGFVRISGARRGIVSADYIRVGGGPEPLEYVVVTHRHFSNLFEVPVLFYAVCIAFFVTRTVDGLAISLAWFFVVARLAHTALVLTTNRPTQRVIPYVLSSFAVFGLWLLLGLRVFRAAAS